MAEYIVLKFDSVKEKKDARSDLRRQHNYEIIEPHRVYAAVNVERALWNRNREHPEFRNSIKQMIAEEMVSRLVDGGYISFDRKENGEHIIEFRGSLDFIHSNYEIL